MNSVWILSIDPVLDYYSQFQALTVFSSKENAEIAKNKFMEDFLFKGKYGKSPCIIDERHFCIEEIPFEESSVRVQDSYALWFENQFEPNRESNL